MPAFDTLGRKDHNWTIDLSRTSLKAPDKYPALDLRDLADERPLANELPADNFYEFMTDIQAPVMAKPVILSKSDDSDADRKWWLGLALISLTLLAGIVVFAVNREYGANGLGDSGRGTGSLMSTFGGKLPGAGGSDTNASPMVTPIR